MVVIGTLSVRREYIWRARPPTEHTIPPMTELMRTDEQIKAIFTDAFKPLRAVMRLIDWDNALEVRVLNEGNASVLRPFNAPLHTLRDGDGIYESIELMRSELESQGFTMDAWDRPA